MLYVGNTKYKVMAGNQKTDFVVPLPYDYEVEYLESTGTQYIDTGINPGAYPLDLDFLVDCQATDFGNTRRMGSQIYNSASSSAFYMIKFPANNYVRVNLSKGGDDFDIQSDMLQRHIISINSTNGTATFDGTSYPVSNSPSVPNTSSVCLFALKGNGTVSNFFVGKIFKASLKTASSTLRDFIPVVKNSIGYMYDKISGQLFGNSGTGNFIIGSRKQ